MIIRPNRVKDRLRQGLHALCFAAWGYSGADHLERLAPARPDGVWLEGEHGDVSFSDLANLTRAIDLIGATPIIRVHQNEAGVIYRCLDLGAMGIVVPHVNSRTEAEAVVEAGKFWPLGKRGSYTSRQGIGVPDYHNLANDQTMLIVLIEDVIGVENLDEILDVEHIDVFFVAPGDLAQTMGLPGMAGDPRVQKVVDETLARIVKRGRTAGALVTEASAAHLYDVGVRFFMSGPATWIEAGFQATRPSCRRRWGMTQIRPNRAKRRLAAGQHVIAIEGLNHPDAIERLAPLQPQAFWLEGEHWIAAPTNIGDLTRACDVSGSTSIARVGRAQKQLIYHALDLGAQGVAVPHVSTAEDAARVVDAAKFAPIGHRGIYISRQGIDVPDYFQRANDETLVVVFIEDAEALDNLDAILEVDHIDVFFVGAGRPVAGRWARRRVHAPGGHQGGGRHHPAHRRPRPHGRHGGIPEQHGARRRGRGQVLPLWGDVVDPAGIQ